MSSRSHRGIKRSVRTTAFSAPCRRGVRFLHFSKHRIQLLIVTHVAGGQHPRVGVRQSHVEVVDAAHLSSDGYQLVYLGVVLAADVLPVGLEVVSDLSLPHLPVSRTLLRPIPGPIAR